MNNEHKTRAKIIILTALVLISSIVVTIRMGQKKILNKPLSPNKAFAETTPTSVESLNYPSTQQLKNQAIAKSNQLNSELSTLEQYAISERHRIENWYYQNLEKLNNWANIKIDEIDEAKKVAYARCLKELKNTTSITSGRAIINTYGQANAHLVNENTAVIHGNTTTNAYYNETSYNFVEGKPIERYQVELNYIQQNKNAILAEFEKLKNQRQQYLNDLDSQVEIKRNRLIAESRSIDRKIEIIQDGGPGIIDSIAWINGKPKIMIDDQLLTVGDYINGFRINKAYKDEYGWDKVEFEKNGKTYLY